MSAANSILVHRTLAAAQGEGLPEPVSSTVYSSQTEPQLHVHLATAEDQARWVDWFTRHDADGWEQTTGTEDTALFTHHLLAGVWRGWSVRLVYLTKPETAEGGEAS